MYLSFSLPNLFRMKAINDFFSRYTVSPSTGIILLNLGILMVFFYQPEPGYYTWVTLISRTLVVLSGLASLLYLVYKSDLSPKEAPVEADIRFEDRGTSFLRMYQLGLPLLILALCGFILYLFKKEITQDWYIAFALFMAAAVQVKILWMDAVVDPFVLRITESFVSLNLKGYEEIEWEEVEHIDWDTEEITFVLADEEEHSIGFGKMLADKAGFIKEIQSQAMQHQIGIAGEDEEIVVEEKIG